MRAVGILWLRQLKRYSRARTRMIGALGQPILFLFALGYGFGPIFARAGQGDYLEFVAPGIVAMGIIFNPVFGGIEIIWDRHYGFLKETLVAQVPRLPIVLGRTLGGATTAMLQGVIVLTICLIAGFRIHAPLLAPLALLFMFRIAWGFSAIGPAIG